MSRNSSESNPTLIQGSQKADEESQNTKIPGVVEVNDLESGDAKKEAILDLNAYAPTDGGWDAWCTVFGTTLVSFGTFGYVTYIRIITGADFIASLYYRFVNAYGAFSDYYNKEYLTNYSATIISMIGALQVFILYLCERNKVLSTLLSLLTGLTVAGTSGAVFDSIGPKYMIPASGVIVVFSLFMLSITKPEHIYQQFLSQSVLFSLGATFR